MPKRSAAHAADADADTVTIVGAGLAGCWLAYELIGRGTAVTLIERGDTVAAGASGNPAGIVKPVAARTPSRAQAFYRAAFAHLLARLAQDGLARACGFQATGAVQLTRKAFPDAPGIESIAPEHTAARTGLDLAAPAVAFDGAGWLRPAELCRALLATRPPDARFGTAVDHIVPDEHGWRLRLSDGGHHRCRRLVLASGPAVAQARPCAHLPITPARGQMDRFAQGRMPRARTVVTGRSWLIPDGDAVWAGATYARDDEDVRLRCEDTGHNRRALEALTGQPAGDALHACAGIRATLPDRLPCVGPIVPPGEHAPLAGLSVLCGFGSRGIVTTALCARLLAAWLHGDEAPLQAWSDLLDPARFERRAGARRRVRA